MSLFVPKALASSTSLRMLEARSFFFSCFLLLPHSKALSSCIYCFYFCFGPTLQMPGASWMCAGISVRAAGSPVFVHEPCGRLGLYFTIIVN